MNVKFLSVKLKVTFDALEVKESSALYWIEETQELYKGDKLYGVGLEATAEFAGLMSAADKAKLDALVASTGGLSNLTAIDGTMHITDTADGGKAIGVAVSEDVGNALSIVKGGLFVPAVSVPEYSIEKQTVADEGYSASYKLKKVVDGAVSYVGDTINIAKDMVLQSATLEVVTEVDVPYVGAAIGDPYIQMTFNNADSSNLYIPVKGLIDTYTAGDGIEIVDNKISVKLADNTHGLVAVDGALVLNLATKDSDGAMSKEDKRILDAIPEIYVSRKYDVSSIPKGTLVNYGEKEIRIMCPADAKFTKQSVGDGGDINSYYVTFKTYVPDDSVVGYIEHLDDKVDSEVLTNIATDENGRRYQPTWLAVAKYDESSGTWNYYGKNSSADRFIGWDYQIDWYNADGVMVASDSIRINLSNEECHNGIRPYYGPNNDVSTDVAELQETVAVMQEAYSWGEM